MFYFSIQQARCFDHPDPIRIRPLTFFVGENSSGKSSAMALMSAVVNATSSGMINFNNEPFTLGAFEQIAHYRGGGGGRKKEFKLGLSAPLRQRQAQRTLFPEPAGTEASYTAAFVARSERPILHSQSFESDGRVAVLNTAVVEKPVLTVRSSNLSQELSLQLEGTPFSYYARQNLTALLRMFRELPMFVRSAAKGKDAIAPEFDDITRELFAHFRQFYNVLPRQVIASAPVRSKPERTYNPAEEDVSPEGRHVPFSMARLKHERTKSWEAFQQYLEEFGEASGMLDSIEIRRFGKTLSDPFQLVVRKQGPRINVVDTGYGISQVLPVLFDLYQKPANALVMLQQPEVHLHPRAQAALGDVFCEATKTQGYLVVETHSDFILDRVRRRIREGKLSPEKVSIAFFVHRDLRSEIFNIDLDSDGAPIDPPAEYREFFLEEQIQNLS